MLHTHSGRPALLLLVLAVVASDGWSQATSREPNAAEVAALLRTKGHAGTALAVLSQARGPRPQQLLDEIADTLVAIAAGFPGSDLRGASTRVAALSTLTAAAEGHTGIVGIERAVPYAGATARLMQLGEKAQDIGVRGAALTALIRLPNRAGSLAFLRDVATSQNTVASTAVSLLANDTGSEGQAIARALYLAGRVTEPSARRLLDAAAEGYGWR